MSKRPVSIRPIYLQPSLAWKLALGLPVLLAMEHSFAAAAPATQGDQLQAVKLSQAHYLLGSTEFTFCQSAMRLDCRGRAGFTLVARAPDWTVTVFRNDEKKIKSLSLKAFDNAGLMPQFLQTSRPRFVPSPTRPYNFKFHGFDAKRIINLYQTEEYLTIQGIAAPEVERIIYSAYRLPTGGGLPIRYIGTAGNRDYFSGKDVRGQRENSLTTSNAQRISVSRDFFRAPLNYHPAKLMQEVVVSSQVRDQSADFQNVFDIANPQTIGKIKPGK